MSRYRDSEAYDPYDDPQIDRDAPDDDDPDRSDSDEAEIMHGHVYGVREELDDQDRAELETLSRLPDWTPRQAAESLQAYGARILEFLIAFACTAPLSDEDLELALYVSIGATAQHDVSPEAIVAINKARRIIDVILKGRAADRAAVQVPGPEPIRNNDKPNQGPMAGLLPVPVSRPPSGQKVQIEF